MTPFRILRAFNDEALRDYARAKARVGRNALPYFGGDTQPERLVRALAAERALPVKEMVESFEFFAVTRRYLRRAPVLVDLCSGHGLVGLLFGVFERGVHEIVLQDRRRPPNFDPVWRACTRLAPWLEEKVRYVERDLSGAADVLPSGAGVVSVHACGRLTDRCLEIGARLGGPLAAMPCCRDHTLNPAPEGLRQALGEDVAYDVERTYALEREGYRVRWREIPEAITPMNRVLIAVPRRGEQERPTAARTATRLRSAGLS